MAENYTNIFKGRNVLITGGIGFIGSNLARHLVHMGANVLIIDSLTSEYGGNFYNIFDIKDKIQINISDVRDSHSMKFLVKNQDYLFNLAGQTSHMDSMADPFSDLEINCHAQLSVLETCRRYNPNIKIVYASTRQIYGKPVYLPVDEKHILQPVDVNGINKMAGERYHILYNDVYGIRACALRLTNTIGPGMRIKDARQTFIGIWIRLLLEGSPFEVWNGHQLRDFTYVDDCVDAMLLVASTEKANGHIYNLGGDCVISLVDLADMLTSIYGSGRYIIRDFPDERKKIDIGDYYSDFSLIRETLGWQPNVPLDEGLRRIIEFYKSHMEHYI